MKIPNISGGADLDRLLVNGWIVCRHTCAWRPPTDIYESDEGLVVRIEVAGMRSEDFSISLAGRKLVISGTRVDEMPKRTYHQMEIRFGEFRAEVHIPWAVKHENVEAKYEEGFLIIFFPPPQSQRASTIKAKIEEDI